MDRLLSPNEAKFWLMDYLAPMNCVVVTQTRRRLDAAALMRDSAFTLPAAVIGRHQRPRWSTRPEDARPGVIDQIDGDAMTWLSLAAGMLDQRVGGGDSPLWRAMLVRHRGEDAGSTLLLTTNHALTDWRTCLLIADAFIAGRHPGELEPACEELLPPSAYGDPNAAELIDGWWTTKAGARWEAVGLDRLASVLPTASPARIDCLRLSAKETAAFQARCRAESATPNGALAVALRDCLGAGQVAHSVDMNRFIHPAPPPGPGLAVSHIFTDLPAAGDTADFWEAAREVRGAVFEQIRTGRHGDALLILPKVLLQREMALTGGSADLTITGAPTHANPSVGDPDSDTTMRLVLSSARGGGDVVLLSYFDGRLQLMSNCPTTGRPPLDLGVIAARLCAATLRHCAKTGGSTVGNLR